MESLTTQYDHARTQAPVQVLEGKGVVLARPRTHAWVQNRTFLTLEIPNPGSGRNIPAIWHGAGAYHDNMLSQKPSTN